MLRQKIYAMLIIANKTSTTTKCSFSNSAKNLQSINPRQYSKNRAQDPTGKWLMLAFPASAFGLGVWQWRRKAWKSNLVKELERKTTAEPILFPTDLSELQNLEYRPLIVRGTFDHSKELYIEPRSLIDRSKNTPIDAGSMMSIQNKNIGVLVITPFHVTDRGITILINRGFVPKDQKKPKARIAGQIEEEIEIVGLLRHNEKRPPLSPKNNPIRNHWFYKDLDQMGSLTGAEPILLDAVFESSVPGGPIGGQTRVSLRDEHLSYMITWFSLSAITSYMWYMRFLK
ncbi:surfeit locus protein 1-like [Ciona intestinalis]